MAYVLRNPEAQIHFESDAQADTWTDVAAGQILEIQGKKKFWEENQQQWGAKAGINSGNAAIEALIPPKLWFMLQQTQPDLLHDDAKWNRFMRAHSELAVKLPKKLF